MLIYSITYQQFKSYLLEISALRRFTFLFHSENLLLFFVYCFRNHANGSFF